MHDEQNWELDLSMSDNKNKENLKDMAIINFDGACSGNPGKMGIGALIRYNEGIKKISEMIGVCTNNIAEYSSLIESLKFVLKLNVKKVIIYGDSKLVINQLFGTWNVKNDHIYKLWNEAKTLIEHLIKKGVKVEGSWIPRELNKEADRLSTDAIHLK